MRAHSCVAISDADLAKLVAYLRQIDGQEPAPVQAAVTVPNVVGQTQAAASSAITGVGLVVGTVTQQSSATVAAGSVISQSPAVRPAWRRARR